MRFLVAAALLLTACPKPQPMSGCDTSTCMGCCDTSGVCQLGQSTATCGTHGALCTPCGTGLGCVQGICAPSSTGGGSGGGTGGSSGTGGGNGGTGGGSVVVTGTNELISGTRLRAINMTGSDGSKAPYSYSIYTSFFWDNQLDTYCTLALSAFYGPFANTCFPVVYASSDPGPGVLYVNASCTQPAEGVGVDVFNDLFVDAGLPPGTPIFLDNDGGLFTAVAGGPAFQRVSDGGCVAAGYQAYSRGTPIPASNLAHMAVTRD